MSDDLIPWLHKQIEAAEASTRALLSGWHDWPDVERMCQQRLAELAAKRRILDLAELWSNAQYPDYDGGYSSALDDVVQLLALPYADHPDYRDEWRPK